ncbi:metallophosphoesterase [Colwellia psychrerythraea]|uniref:3,5-cyclic adenosine monophosphate phosphodiesterase CpdA n=1 Tax=Colwellia psychrerythraea TaxID=28229 RepID=A0A099KFA5_COLPS|nr:metallophosphoesterase [Colwellia psychrerythraea]KGJ89031.1 3,5-cyclic adenosine monophosphate phosphodiesterase CpdA [Colwellia psychrerythraea]
MHSIESYPKSNKPIVLAQISDSHLFASIDSLHHGHNVLANLKKVLLSICQNPVIDSIVFTGDLTQDHSEQSYQNFVDCVHECDVCVPIYYLAGNHDEPELLDKYFSKSPFQADKTLNLPQWQVQLIDSKSETPAGHVSEQALGELKDAIKADKHQLVMMHHHPIDVGYFIDKHGLQNQTGFWQVIDCFDNVKAIACGHVHSAIQLSYPLDIPLETALVEPLVDALVISPNKSLSQQGTQKVDKVKEPVTLYTCPATSIQFDPSVDGVAALDKGPGYRLFHLFANGKIATDVIYL